MLTYSHSYLMGEDKKKGKSSAKQKSSKKRLRETYQDDEEQDIENQPLKKIINQNSEVVIKKKKKKSKSKLDAQVPIQYQNEKQLQQEEAEIQSTDKSKKKKKSKISKQNNQIENNFSDQQQGQKSQIKQKKQKNLKNTSQQLLQEPLEKKKKKKKVQKSAQEQNQDDDRSLKTSNIIKKPNKVPQDNEVNHEKQLKAPKSKKKIHKEKPKQDTKSIIKQQQLEDVSDKEDILQQNNITNSKSTKNQQKKKNQKIESINVLNRQMAKQCITKKSNFYLQKQENLKQGLPVGRGSKKAQEKMQQQRKRILNQRNKKKKELKRNSSIENLSVKQQAQSEFGKESSDQETKQTKTIKQSTKKKKDQCTKEESIRIINAFSADAGDYRGMVKDMPDIPLAKMRGHLRMLFQRNLQIITKRVQESGKMINDWYIMEKREIIRQLHRIRCTNRLLSEGNVDFREKFLKLMMSYNDPTLCLTDNDFNFLYRKIERFVRGFCSLAASKKKSEVKFEATIDENRQPLLEGGYIMDRNRVKRQVKVEEKLQEVQTKKIEPEKIILQWTEQQQRQLCNLYILHQANSEAIHEQIKIKFGFKTKWKDFSLLNQKIDHLIKMGLYKLHQLTTKPYNRQKRIEQEQEKQKMPVNETDPNASKADVNSLDLMTKFIYNNKKVVAAKSQQATEGGLFKNLSLLQRQIFANVESSKSRFALVKLLNEKFPPEEDINEAIQVIKQFVAYVIEWEKKNHILLLRQEPVLQKQKDISTSQRLQKDIFSNSSKEDNQDRFDALTQQLQQLQNPKNVLADSPDFQNNHIKDTQSNQDFNIFDQGDNLEQLMNAALNE